VQMRRYWCRSDYFSYLDEMKEYIDLGIIKMDYNDLVGCLKSMGLNILSAQRVYDEWREIPKQKAREEAERLKREKALKEAKASIEAISGAEAVISDIMYCVNYEPPLEVHGQLESVIGSTVKVFRDANGKDYSVDCLKSWAELTELQQAQIEQADKIKRVTGKVKAPKLIENWKGFD